MDLLIEPLFESFVSVETLGIASQVCRSWRASARERARAALRGEMTLEVGDHPVYMASLLLGAGGMGRVYQLAGLPELCIKVCVGGGSVRACGCTDPFSHHFSPACQKTDHKERQVSGDVLVAMYRWQSNTTDMCGRMSPEGCEDLMREEHALLSRLPRPVGDGLRGGSNPRLG